MKKLLVIALVLIAVPAFAQQTVYYGWEDGGTILGYTGNGCCESNVTGPQTGLTGGATPSTWTTTGAYDGDHYLHVAEEPHSSTPYIFVAWVKGLVHGDAVAASFYGWDSVDFGTYNGEPALRIWGYYTAGDDIYTTAGSAGAGLNNSGYTTALGWQPVSTDWIFDQGDTSQYDPRTGIRIDARLYSTPTTSEDHTDYWIDHLTLTVPDHATVIFPEPASAIEPSTWTRVKALYR